MKNSFYVYFHVRLDNDKVFYIGYGKDNRAWDRRKPRNTHWKNIVNKHGYKVLIHKDNLTKEQACKLEVAMIKQYGLDNLSNMTEGGTGGKQDLETRRKMKIRCKIRKKVIQKDKDGIELYCFYSVDDAAKFNHIDRRGIDYVCSGKRLTSAGYKWSYAC